MWMTHQYNDAMSIKKKKKKEELRYEQFMVLFRTTASVIIGTVLLLFVIANSMSAQYMPKIFFDLANDSEKSIVELLIKAKDIEQFKYLFPEVRHVIAKNSEAIYKESNDRSAQIQTLLTLLQSNPESPEILYALHILYQADKDMVNADMYLQKARLIDPQIGL